MLFFSCCVLENVKYLHSLLRFDLTSARYHPHLCSTLYRLQPPNPLKRKQIPPHVHELQVRSRLQLGYAYGTCPVHGVRNPNPPQCTESCVTLYTHETNGSEIRLSVSWHLQNMRRILKIRATAHAQSGIDVAHAPNPHSCRLSCSMPPVGCRITHALSFSGSNFALLYHSA